MGKTHVYTLERPLSRNVLFSLGSSTYQLGCTIVAVSAPGCGIRQKCFTKHHDWVDAPECTILKHSFFTALHNIALPLWVPACVRSARRAASSSSVPAPRAPRRRVPSGWSSTSCPSSASRSWTGWHPWCRCNRTRPSGGPAKRRGGMQGGPTELYTVNLSTLYVVSIFSMTSLKHHIEYFDFRCWIQLDLPVECLLSDYFWASKVGRESESIVEKLLSGFKQDFDMKCS